MEEAETRLKRFYRLYIAPLVCLMKGHIWKKVYLLDKSNGHHRYRTHCQRCYATSFEFDIVEKKVQKSSDSGHV